MRPTRARAVRAPASPNGIRLNIDSLATELNEKQALIIVYDGKAWPRPKDFRPGYLGFRAVKEPTIAP